MTKEKYLIEAGFKVLRVTDEEVLRHIEGVRESIALFVQEIEQSTPLLPRQQGTTEQNIDKLIINTPYEEPRQRG